MASRLVGWAVSWFKKGGTKQEDQESQNEEQLPSSSVDISSDGNTCLESVTQERLSQISCSEHPLQAGPRTVTIPEPSIDGEEEWYDCELCQGSCSAETPEQGEREVGTQIKQECETSHDTQQSDQQLVASKLPHGCHNAPSLVELVSLPITDWHSLGLQLGVTHHRLKTIQANNAQYPDSLERCMADMFETWLNDDHEPSYEKIGKALCAVGMPMLAQQFCRQQGIVLEMCQHPTVVTQYAEHLRSQYLCQSVCPDSDWPPLIGEQYTELALIEHERQLESEEYAQFIAENRAHGKIDHIVAERKETELADMLMSTSEHCNQVRVLIDGTPGVGKTTLCRKMSRDWANGKLLKEYDVVLLLHLRDKRIAKARSLEDIFFHPDPVLRAEVVVHILQSGGKNVLLILDGLDELSHRDRTEDSLFLDLIHKKLLPNCSLIITSRPYASESLVQLKCIDRHVEVLGFTEKQIVKCIRDSIKDEDEAAKLVESLQERQDIMLICYVPLFCAIAMYIFTRKFTLPGTMTELLTLFLLNSVNRHLKLQKSRLEVRNLFNLPGPLAQDFECLCELAFVNLMKNRFMFNYEELRQAFPHCEREDVEFHTLGLLTAVKSFTSFSEETSYQFLHLTIQEYLAARHIVAKLSPEEQAGFFKQHLEHQWLGTTLVFLVGLSSSALFPTLEELTQPVATHALLFIIHCIYESQNPQLCSALANGMQYIIDLRENYFITPFQSRTLAYFLSSSGCSWNTLHFPVWGFDDRSLEAFQKCCNSVHVQGSQVESASFFPFLMSWPPRTDLTGNALEVIGRTVLFRHLRTLKIALGQCDNVVSMCNGLRLLGDLQTLDLSFFGPSSHVFCKLMEELGNKRALQHFHLVGSVDDEAAKHLSNMVKDNHTLQTLELSHCNLTAAGSCMLFEAVKVNCNLMCLDISKSDSLLGQYLLSELNPTLEALEDMLRWNHTLARFHSNMVSGIAVECIAAGLVRNKGLKSLDTGIMGDLDILSCRTICPGVCIGTLAAVNLFKVLQINDSLEELKFMYSSDVEMECCEVLRDSLEKMLAQNTVLRVLRLIPFMFSESNLGWLFAAKGIASGHQSNSSLTHLSVENYEMAGTPPWFLGSTLTQLLKAVANHPSLTNFSIWTGSLWEEHIRGIFGVLSSSNSLISLTVQTTTGTSNVLPTLHKLAEVTIDCSIPQNEKGIITCNGRKISFEFQLLYCEISYKILSFEM